LWFPVFFPSFTNVSNYKTEIADFESEFIDKIFIVKKLQ